MKIAAVLYTLRYRVIALWGVLFIAGGLAAHSINEPDLPLRQWSVMENGTVVQGSFLFLRDAMVHIEKADHSVLSVPLADLGPEDRRFVRDREARIAQLNRPVPGSAAGPMEGRSWAGAVMALILLAALGAWALRTAGQPALRTVMPVLLVGLITMLYGFRTRNLRDAQSLTDPLTVDSAFTPFKPGINTFWDNDYFHVESNGIPDHAMMVGITNWQQQVPIPQCYTGTNSWSIPLNPVIAATPVPVSPQHFIRGAIAVAVNGVPIFNPYTNTGVDAFLDGQLDDFGGHCGRADDYHYHIAPLSLYGQTSATLPIAYALDGFAVFGSVEPDGSPMAALDANHGHYGTNGVYHYHGTATAPYMIGNMVGEVTEDATLQIVPQAHANPVRPFQSPLPGAEILGCTENGNGNGYAVVYSLNGQLDSVVYDWTSSGVFTFNQYTGGLPVTTSYTAQPPCVVINAIEEPGSAPGSWSIYPVPTDGAFVVAPGPGASVADIRGIEVHDLRGRCVFATDRYPSTIDAARFGAGTYLVRTLLADGAVTKKLVVR